MASEPFICPFPLVHQSREYSSSYQGEEAIWAFEEGECAVRCPTITYTEGEWHSLVVVTTALVVFGTLSGLSSLAYHVWNIHQPGFFTKAMFIVGFVVSGLAMAIFLGVNGADRQDLVCNGNGLYVRRNPFCVIQAFCTIYFFTWTQVWSVALCLDTYLNVIYRARLPTMQLQRYYMAATIIIPGVIGIIPLAAGNLGFDPQANIPICLYLFSENSLYFWFTFYMPTFVAAIAVVSLSIASFVKLNQIFIESEAIFLARGTDVDVEDFDSHGLSDIFRGALEKKAPQLAVSSPPDGRSRETSLRLDTPNTGSSGRQSSGPQSTRSSVRGSNSRTNSVGLPHINNPNARQSPCSDIMEFDEEIEPPAPTADFERIRASLFDTSEGTSSRESPTQAQIGTGGGGGFDQSTASHRLPIDGERDERPPMDNHDTSTVPQASEPRFCEQSGAADSVAIFMEAEGSRRQVLKKKRNMRSTGRIGRVPRQSSVDVLWDLKRMIDLEDQNDEAGEEAPLHDSTSTGETGSLSIHQNSEPTLSLGNSSQGANSSKGGIGILKGGSRSLLPNELKRPLLGQWGKKSNVEESSIGSRDRFSYGKDGRNHLGRGIRDDEEEDGEDRQFIGFGNEVVSKVIAERLTNKLQTRGSWGLVKATWKVSNRVILFLFIFWANVVYILIVLFYALYIKYDDDVEGTEAFATCLIEAAAVCQAGKSPECMSVTQDTVNAFAEAQCGSHPTVRPKMSLQFSEMIWATVYTIIPAILFGCGCGVWGMCCRYGHLSDDLPSADFDALVEEWDTVEAQEEDEDDDNIELDFKF
jgi:hypothetical protein